MGLFGSGKTDEDKLLEQVAKCLENLCLKEKDGLLHAGLFTLELGILSDDGKGSKIVDAVLEYLQKQGYEIADVKFAKQDATFGFTFLVLYR